MKKINFISALQPSDQYELYYWFWITLFICMLFIACTLYFIAPVVLKSNALKKEVESLHRKTKQYAELKNKYTLLKKEYETACIRETKINKYITQTKNSYSRIAPILTTMPNSIQLESFEWRKNDGALHITATSIHYIQQFIDQLKKLEQYNQIILQSLEQNQSQQLFCIIKISFPIL